MSKATYRIRIVVDGIGVWIHRRPELPEGYVPTTDVNEAQHMTRDGARIILASLVKQREGKQISDEEGHWGVTRRQGPGRGHWGWGSGPIRAYIVNVDSFWNRMLNEYSAEVDEIWFPACCKEAWEAALWLQEEHTWDDDEIEQYLTHCLGRIGQAVDLDALVLPPYPSEGTNPSSDHDGQGQQAH